MMAGRVRRQGFHAAVDLAHDHGLAVGDIDLRGKRCLRPAQQRGQHLAGLVAVVVNRLLAQDHQLRLFLVHQRLEQLGHGQWLQLFGGFHQDGAVGANGHGRAQGFLALRHAAAHRNHLGHHTLFLQPGGLFDGDLVKRVHAHLDVGDIDTGAIGFDADFDVVIHNAFDGDENLHEMTFFIRSNLKWNI